MITPAPPALALRALNPASAAMVSAWNLGAVPARYAVVADPMLTLQPQDLQPVPPGASFADLVAPHAGRWLCQVAGEGMAADAEQGGAYLPMAWWHTEPRPGDVVVFHRRALGGGNTGRSLLQLAVVLVAAYATAGLSAYAGSAAGFGLSAGAASAVGALGGAAVILAGTALVNSLVPLDQNNLSTDGSAQSPTYSTSLQGNSARLGQPLPVLYGYNNTYPDFACKPYQIFDGNEQYYHAVLCVSVGHLQVLRVAIDDTPIDQFKDVEYKIIGPGQADGETLADQTLVKTTIIEAIEAPAGDMVSLKVVGPVVVVPRGLQAIAVHVHLALPRGLGSGLGVEWVAQVREVNEFEQPIGGWVTLATETYATASAVPVRLSYRYTVTAGRWQFRTYRTDIRSTDANAAHDLAFAGVACEINTPGVDVSLPATYVVLRMRGSQQLSGVSQRRVRVLSTRLLPSFDSGVWSAPAPTRHIAWAAADVLRNTDYGRALGDDQIDLQGLLALHGEWAARFDKYDGAFDTTGDTWGALTQVLRAGRAVPLVRGSRYAFVRDGDALAPVAMYSERNMRKGSFALQLAVPERDQITALDVEYWDQQRWDWVTLTVQYVGATESPPFVAYEGDAVPSPYTRADNRARLRLPGIIGPAHCAREGAYRLADMLFRRSKASYRTHLDGLLPAYLAPVLVAHEVPAWGQSGDVVGWDAGTGTVTTSEPLAFGAGTHYLRLQNPAGGVIDWEVTAGAGPTEAIVADDLGFTPSVDSANRERTRYVFGPSVAMGAVCRVRAITPRGQRDIEHSVVLEDGRVHLADAPWMPVEGLDPDPAPSDGSSGAGEDSDILVVRLLARAVTGTTLSGVGSTGIDIVAEHTLIDDGTAATAYVGSTGSGGGALPNEWLQGGAVAPAAAALYEVRDTLVSSADPVAGGAATLTGTLGAWQSLGAQRSLVLTWVSPAEENFAQRVVQREIRDAATATVQDSALITLRCEYPGSGGGA